MKIINHLKNLKINSNKNIIDSMKVKCIEINIEKKWIKRWNSMT